MAPEQAAAPCGQLTATTDIHALGAILYELLTGRPPFLGTSTLETLDQVRHQNPVPPRRLNRKIPRDLETIALKCLEKNPSRRYASAEALAGDLRRWLDGKPIAARPVPPIEHASRWCRRRPAIATLAATFLLAVQAASSACPPLETRRVRTRKGRPGTVTGSGGSGPGRVRLANCNRASRQVDRAARRRDRRDSQGLQPGGDGSPVSSYPDELSSSLAELAIRNGSWHPSAETRTMGRMSSSLRVLRRLENCGHRGTIRVDFAARQHQIDAGFGPRLLG